MSGLVLLQILEEPTAAALAEGFQKFVNATETKNLLVYDLGGGTLDVTILQYVPSEQGQGG